jgi:hypothetical protein
LIIDRKRLRRRLGVGKDASWIEIAVGNFPEVEEV